MKARWRTALARMVAPLAMAGVVAAAPSAAFGADPKEACFTAYEQGQRVRHRGGLQAARDQFSICAADACPAPVKKDCTQWLGEVQKSLASIVVSVRDTQGQETASVEVFVDDQRIAQRLDGKPITLDPGSHTLRYVLGERSREEKIFLGEGEQRRITADFGESSIRVAGQAGGGAPSEPRDKAEKPGGEGLPTGAIVLGALAAVGLVSFATFGIAGKVVQGCSPTCQQSSISAMRLDYAIADISLLVGLAAAGGAVYFLLTKPAPSAVPAMSAGASALWLSAGPLAGGGAALEAAGRF